MSTSTSRPEFKAGYTISEAAEFLGIGETFMRTMIREGRCRTVRFGQRIIVPKAELERLLAEGATGTNKAPARAGA